MSDRIMKLVSCLRPGRMLFDLCCDHGMIGLAGLGGAKGVVLVDQSETALRAVRDRLETLSTAESAKVQVINAAAEELDISAHSGSDFIIAGVGVTTMVTIIAALFPTALADHRLILSPQQDSLPLRWFLDDRRFGLVDEFVVMEKGRFREILVIEAQGHALGEAFAAERDELSRRYGSWLRNYRRRIAAKKSQRF
jgi:tRNA (adenine22-N1)-methyltransferase